MMLCLTTLTLLAIPLFHHTQAQRVVVSGYNSKLATYQVSGEDLILTGEWDVGVMNQNMTWLQLDNDINSIWAGHEVANYSGKPGSVISRWEFSSNQDGQRPELKQFVSTGSVYTAHLLVDKKQGMAYAANYGGSSFTAVSLHGNQLGQVVYREFPKNCRDASHPHETVTHEEHVYVMDLGCDAVRHYTVKERKLSKISEVSLPVGAGPRHMLLHSNGFAYLVCELQSLVFAFRRNETTGELTQVQSLKLSSTHGDAGAEILAGPDGKYLYVSSRGSGVVVVYEVQDDNTLARLQEFKLAGTWPRSMAIKDQMMLVIDQYGDSVQVVKIDPKNGKLAGGKTFPTPKQPSFVGFMD